MTAKNDGVGAWGTIVSIAESPVMPGVLWVGTDDGNLQVSRDEGATWTNVADAAAKFAGNYYVQSVEPSHFDAARHTPPSTATYAGDYKPYLFKTTDFGQTWTSFRPAFRRAGTSTSSGKIASNRNSALRRHRVRVSTCRSTAASPGSPFMRNLPATTSDDVLVHPRDQDLVLATHGRSFFVLDDITPLQQLTPAILGEEHLFRPRTLSSGTTTGRRFTAAAKRFSGARILRKARTSAIT